MTFLFTYRTSGKMATCDLVTVKHRIGYKYEQIKTWIWLFLLNMHVPSIHFSVNFMNLLQYKNTRFVIKIQKS